MLRRRNHPAERQLGKGGEKEGDRTKLKKTETYANI